MKIPDESKVKTGTKVLITGVTLIAFLASDIHEVTPEKFLDRNYWTSAVNRSAPPDHSPHNPVGIVYTMDKVIAVSTSTESSSIDWIQKL
jgi:hypothetical protein